MKHEYILLAFLLCLSSVQGIDFGISKISGAFQSVIPGLGSSENATSTSTTQSNLEESSSTISDNEPTPTTNNIYKSTSTTAKSVSTSYTTTLKTRNEEATTGESTNFESPTTTIRNHNETTSNSTQDDNKDKDGASASSSWIPDIVKKPVDAVASVPNKLANTAGDVWDTVSETVVNQDPTHNVKFYFYDDPKNLSKYKQIVVGQEDTLRSIRIAPESRLNILIHGFMQDYNSSFPQEMKDTLLMHIGGPVVCVDWGHMADGKFGPDALRTLLYPFIVDNVATVGEYVGEFVVFLKNNSVISSYDQVHVIGFSLGGHVSGIAGWTVQNRTNGEKLGRITGLDPAGPKFFLKTQERKLNQDDAKFVDVIHTSHLGYFLSLGHIDFFPNGGKLQPGCVETDEGITDAVASLGSVLTGSCSHARAWEYYVKSIKDNELYGCECNNIFKYELTGCEAECKDKMPFGESTPSSGRGAYYLSI